VSDTSRGRLAGKVALVTGAGSGVGQATVKAFVDEGATVVGTGRSLDKLADTRQLVQGRADLVSCDVSDESATQALIDETVEKHGRLDILVNAAGIGGSAYRMQREGGMAGLAETPTEHFDELMRNNLYSVYFACKTAVAHMRRQGGGAIVNVSSISARKGMPTAHAYAVTKAGIENITRQLGHTYGREGIRTNCICPGTIDTPMMVGSPVMDLLDPSNPDRFQYNPMGRAGTPEEMANGILFLASDEASYVNGAVLPIDGGSLT